ncbi:AAA family ATPase [Coxiella burnetii]|uniref:AAA family ATPase n=1 Tax=Coxiella burnetii TaxID=777 RepID=UPI0022314156|nr:AAA family ATPase [Coxiella burnetii]
MIKKIEAKQYPALSLIDIQGGSIACIRTLLGAVAIGCENVHRVILPAYCEERISNIKFPFQFSKELQSFQNLVETNETKSEFSSDYTHRIENNNTIFISQTNLRSVWEASLDQNSTPRKNVLAGEVLNPGEQKAQRVRTGIIEIDLMTLAQRYFTPSKKELLPIRISILSEKDINAFRNKEVDAQGRYFKFTQTLTPGEPNRLLSIDTAEIFIGIVNSLPVGCKLHRCRQDDFFYATVTKPCTLTYVIKSKTHEQQQNCMAELPNEIQAIINNYNCRKEILTEDPALTKSADENFPDWLERIYTRPMRYGSCRHRVLAVFNHLIKNGLLKKEALRMSRIDNNHVRLEIKFNNLSWVPIDLGGRSGGATLFHPAATYTSTKTASKKKLVSEMTAFELPALEIKLSEAKQNGTEENSLIKKLTELTTPISIDDEPSLKAQLNKPNQMNIALILADSEIEVMTCYLLSRSVEQGKPVYVIDGPEALNLWQASLKINDNEIQIENPPFYRFLYSLSKNPIPATLIIHWNAFSPVEQVALNTLLDTQRSVAGYKIPDSVQIIGLNTTAGDSAFFSRHDVVGKVNFLIPDKPEYTGSPSVSNEFTFDCFAFSDWRKQLFGPVVLEKNQLIWHKSQFVKWLAEVRDPTVIHLKNLPEKAHTACRNFIALARAVGYFIYHGHLIPFSKNAMVDINTDDFDFHAFPSTQIITQATREKVPYGTPIVNGALFDYLLFRQHVENGQYTQSFDGWLKAKTNSHASFWITGRLSESQWYCLLAMAENLRIKLSLYLAPGVKPPASLPIVSDFLDRREEKNEAALNLPRVFIESNKIIDVPKNENEVITIDVEDCSYQDLIECIEFELSEGNFQNFRCKQSQLLEKLKDENNEIILRGKFSTALLETLHPLLAGESILLSKGETVTVKAKLTFIVEVKAHECSVTKGYEPLAWLGGQITFIPLNAVTSNRINVVYRESDSDSSDLSKDSAQAFLQIRRNSLKKALDKNQLVQLVGPTGVGKSHLMKILSEEENYSVHYGLENFVAWAGEGSDREKILFLDEVNLINQHLTFLNPLKTSRKATLFYRGSFYPLTSQHKVVIAQNPVTYGGNRQKQKLLADGKIPALYFSQLPAYILYWEILHPIWESFPRNVAENKFKKESLVWIEKYRESCKVAEDDRSKPSTRELQYQAQAYLFNQRPRINKLRWADYSVRLFPQSSTQFITTIDNSRLQAEIQEFIGLHRVISFPSLNGCYIQGPPGTGKTALIRYMLTINRIEFIKLEANLPTSKLEQKILKAFEEGRTIWIDELNSCSDSLERILNSVLSGINPYTGAPPRQPGFMAFFSGNSIALGGVEH